MGFDLLSGLVGGIGGMLLGGGSKSSSPSQIDPYEAARANAQYNRLNLLSPFGTFSYGTIGKRGQFVPGGDVADATTARLMLDPASQRFRNRAFSFGQNRLARFGPWNVPGPSQFGPESQRLAQEFMDFQTGLLDPVFERRNAQLAETLANQGLPIGTGAYNEAVGIESGEQARAYQQAAQQAALIGADRQSQLYNQALMGRGQQFSELAQILGLGMGLTGPNAQIPGVDTSTGFAAAQSAANQSAMINAQNRSSLLGGLGTLGAATAPWWGPGLFGALGIGG